MAERINEELLANTPKGGKFGSDGILRHTESALKVSVVSKKWNRNIKFYQAWR